MEKNPQLSSYEAEIWLKVFIAAIRAGQNSLWAKDAAMYAVAAYREAYWGKS